jgi:hypothetical protein
MGGNISALSGEITLVGETPSTKVSALETERVLTGVSSRLCDNNNNNNNNNNNHTTVSGTKVLASQTKKAHHWTRFLAHSLQFLSSEFSSVTSILMSFSHSISCFPSGFQRVSPPKSGMIFSHIPPWTLKYFPVYMNQTKKPHLISD